MKRKIVFSKFCFSNNCFCENLFVEKLLCCPHLFGNSNKMILYHGSQTRPRSINCCFESSKKSADLAEMHTSMRIDRKMLGRGNNSLWKQCLAKPFHHILVCFRMLNDFLKSVAVPVRRLYCSKIIRQQTLERCGDENSPERTVGQRFIWRPKRGHVSPPELLTKPPFRKPFENLCFGKLLKQLCHGSKSLGTLGKDG